MTFVYDRTSYDVQYAKDIEQKAKSGDAESYALFLSDLKGRYNAYDINRCADNFEMLSDGINEIDYIINEYSSSANVFLDDHPNIKKVFVSYKSDWKDTDDFYASDLDSYLSCFAILRSSIPLYNDTPLVPSRVSTYTEANDLERILFDIDKRTHEMIAEWKSIIDRTNDAYVYAGMEYANL